MQNFALLNQYHTQAAKVESKRYQVLCQQSRSPAYTTAINNMYDCYHGVILDQMEQNLQGQRSVNQTGPIEFIMDSSSQEDMSPLAAAERLAAMQSSADGVVGTSATEAPPTDEALASSQVLPSVHAASRLQYDTTQASMSTPFDQSPSPVLADGVAQIRTFATEAPPTGGALASSHVLPSVHTASRLQSDTTQASMSTPFYRSPSPVLAVLSQE